MADKSEDLSDVRAEETSRGRKQPVKAGALHRKRAIRRLSRILDNPKLDFAVYLEAICELEAERGLGRVSATPRALAEEAREPLIATRVAERIRLSCSSGVNLERYPETILVNSSLNSRAEIFRFFAGLDFLAKSLRYTSLPKKDVSGTLYVIPQNRPFVVAKWRVAIQVGPVGTHH